MISSALWYWLIRIMLGTIKLMMTFLLERFGLHIHFLFTLVDFRELSYFYWSSFYEKLNLLSDITISMPTHLVCLILMLSCSTAATHPKFILVLPLIFPCQLFYVYCTFMQICWYLLFRTFTTSTEYSLIFIFISVAGPIRLHIFLGHGAFIRTRWVSKWLLASYLGVCSSDGSSIEHTTWGNCIKEFLIFFLV